MGVTVVVGTQWGDEGKGKVVDHAAADADYVVRYNGGNNAGHTVMVGEEVFKLHIVPVGVLRQNVTPVIADGVVFDPKVFLAELDDLNARGVRTDRIRLSGSAHVIMPYHRVLDRLEEESKGDSKIGTTGMGIGPCYADKVSRTGIRVWDLIDPERLRAKIEDQMRLKNRLITAVYGGEALDGRAIYEEYTGFARRIAPFVCDTTALVYEACARGARVILEGAHASLLDIDHGTYPFVTSSHCVAGGACIGTGIGPTGIANVIGVAKAYTTRVGEGPCPTELNDAVSDRIRERGHEYGTTTGRPRRCGWFDAVAVRYSARINGLSSVALTRLDVLSELDSLRLCTHYSIGGREVCGFPTDTDLLSAALPVYEDLPGWRDDIGEARTFEDLPANARRYVERIEQLIGVPVTLVSVGPERDSSIVRTA